MAVLFVFLQFNPSNCTIQGNSNQTQRFDALHKKRNENNALLFKHDTQARMSPKSDMYVQVYPSKLLIDFAKSPQKPQVYILYFLK